MSSARLRTGSIDADMTIGEDDSFTVTSAGVTTVVGMGLEDLASVVYTEAGGDAASVMSAVSEPGTLDDGR